MARQTYEQQLAVVQDHITTAGGELAHNALVDALTAGGNARVALQLPGMSQRGDIVAVVRAVPDAKPVLSYSLPTEG